MSSTPPPVRPSRPAARRSAAPAKAPAKSGKKRGVRLRFAMPKGRWVRAALVVFGIPFVLGLFVMVYLWVSYGRMIDAKLGGEVQPVPRIFGRPFEFQAGRALSPAQLVQRLNDIGYAQREKAELPGEFALPAANVVQLVTRAADKTPPRALKIDFTTSASPIVRRVVDAQNKPVDQVTLEAPMLTALAPGQKRRFVPLASIPAHMVQAVLAIEDRRFYDHPGVDPIRAVGALITNIRGDKPYLVGASTLTQQIVKNTFLTPEKTLKRKLQEQYMALVLDSRLTKDQILELYLNDVVLGQRGPFAIHGVGEAARIFFGKDVNNVSVSEAADDRGPDPVAVGALAVPQSGAGARAAQRRAHRDGPGGLHHARGRQAIGRGAVQGRHPRPGKRSAVLRRLRHPPARERLQGPAQEERRRGRVHVARPAPAAHGAGSRGRRHRADRQAAAGAATRQGPGRADRHGPEDRRDPRARGRAQLLRNAVQPGGHHTPAARLDLQAVRLPRRVREDGRRGRQRI